MYVAPVLPALLKKIHASLSPVLLEFVKVQGLDPLVPSEIGAVDQWRERQIPRGSNGLAFGFI